MTNRWNAGNSTNVDIPHADFNGPQSYIRFRDRPAAHTAMYLRDFHADSPDAHERQWELRDKHAHITNRRRLLEWRSKCLRVRGRP